MTTAQAPTSLLNDKSLLARVSACNTLVFLADAGTLFAYLHALGQGVSFGTAFIALIMASIVVTLGPIPLGLGSFEAASTATLHLLGMPLRSGIFGNHAPAPADALAPAITRTGADARRPQCPAAPRRTISSSQP